MTRYTRVGLITLMLLLGFYSGYTQKNDAFIGEGEDETDYFPMRLKSNYSRTEILYLSSEIQSSGLITSLSFYVGEKSGSFNLDSLKVYLKHTSNSYLSNNNFSLSGYSSFEVNKDVLIQSGGWIELQLKGGFEYNGEDNLSVFIEYGKELEQSVAYCNFLYFGSGEQTMCKYGYDNDNFPDNGQLTIDRPIIKITFDGFSIYTGMDKSIDANDTIILGQYPITTGYTYEDFTYSWSLLEGDEFSDSPMPSITPSSYAIYSLSVNSIDAEFERNDNLHVHVDQTNIVTHNDLEVYKSSGSFYDAGGIVEEYSYLQNYIVVFYPESPNHVLNFTSNEIDIADGDFIKIYSDTAVVNENLLQTVTGDQSIEFEGELGEPVTFWFFSDQDITGNGWDIYFYNRRVNSCDDITEKTSFSLLNSDCNSRNIKLELDSSNQFFSEWEYSDDGEEYIYLSDSQTFEDTAVSSYRYYRAKFSDTDNVACYSSSMQYTSTCDLDTIIILTSKDARIFSNSPNDNFGDRPEIKAKSWTYSGIPANARSLIEFALNDIPHGSIIDKASLHLFGVQQYALNSDNEALLLRAKEPWFEKEVTWNNQPPWYVVDSSIIPGTPLGVDTTVDFAVDVTDFFRGWSSNEYENHGFVLKLKNETYYAANEFASSDYADTTKHPYAELIYIERPVLIIDVHELLEDTFPICKLNGGGYQDEMFNSSKDTFLLVPPIEGNLDTLNIVFSDGNNTNHIYFTVDELANPQGVYRDSSCTQEFLSDLYSLSNHYLYFNHPLLGNDSKLNSPISIDLKDGLVMIPNSEANNVFSITPLVDYEEISITIYDFYGIEVFSTQKNTQWDGRTNAYETGELENAMPGTYYYTVIIDDIEIQGQFLIRYE